MKRILIFLVVMLIISCTPGIPKYHIAEQVGIKGTQCTGTVVKASYSHVYHEWRYKVAFRMKCATCKKTPDYLRISATIVLPQNMLQPTPPFDKEKISPPSPQERNIHLDDK